MRLAVESTLDEATAEPVVGGENGAGAQRQSAKTGVRY